MYIMTFMHIIVKYAEQPLRTTAKSRKPSFVCGHIFWQIGNSVILSAAKNLVFLAAWARFFAALRMTDLARKNGRTPSF